MERISGDIIRKNSQRDKHLLLPFVFIQAWLVTGNYDRGCDKCPSNICKNNILYLNMRTHRKKRLTIRWLLLSLIITALSHCFYTLPYFFFFLQEWSKGTFQTCHVSYLESISFNLILFLLDKSLLMSQNLHLNFPAFINLFNGKEEVKYQNTVFSFTKKCPSCGATLFYGAGRSLNDNLDF